MIDEITSKITLALGLEHPLAHNLISLAIVVTSVFVILRTVEYLLLKNFQLRNKHTNADTKSSELKLNTVTKMLDGFIKFVTFFFILIEVMLAFGVDKTQIIAITSTLSVALGFAAQGLVKDLINGVVIVTEDQYKLGDFVMVNNEFRGEVEKLTMRVTQLRDVDGSLHIIPNSSIVSVTTLSKEFIKAIVTVGVEYSADTAFVIRKLEEEMQLAYEEMSGQMLEPPKVLGISAFTDNAVNIKIICDTVVGEKNSTEYALRLRIKEMFDREGIVMPFPQRDVYIKTEQKKI